MQICHLAFDPLHGFRKCTSEAVPEAVPMQSLTGVATLAVSLLLMIAVPSMLSHMHIRRSYSLLSLGATLLSGVVVYQLLEGWSLSDSLYFMIVTATTVGYGDLSPATELGRIFTCAYALIGTAQISSAYTPVVERAIGLLEALSDTLLPNRIDSRRESISLEEINREISYPRRYLRAALPSLLLLVAVALARLWQGDGVVDALYFATVTCTTVGYGDIAPSTGLGRVAAALYLPFVVTALATMQAEWSKISTRRAIREEDGKLAARLDAADAGVDLTELEFTIEVLQAHDLVDETTLLSIKKQFQAYKPKHS